MNFIISKIKTDMIDKSDLNIIKANKVSDNEANRHKQFFVDILQYLPYYLLLFLFLRTFFTNDFLFCLLIIFGIITNNFIKLIKQEAPVSLIIITLYFIPRDKSKFYTILLFYLSSIFQVMRLSGTRFYTKLRKFRIWSGPIYGCLLFWRIVNSFGIVQMDCAALILFLVGVKFRPNYFEGNYEENRRTHKYLMISSFCFVLIEDFTRLYFN